MLVLHYGGTLPAPRSDVAKPFLRTASSEVEHSMAVRAREGDEVIIVDSYKNVAVRGHIVKVDIHENNVESIFDISKTYIPGNTENLEEGRARKRERRATPYGIASFVLSFVTFVFFWVNPIFYVYNIAVLASPNDIEGKTEHLSNMSFISYNALLLMFLLPILSIFLARAHWSTRGASTQLGNAAVIAVAVSSTVTSIFIITALLSLLLGMSTDVSANYSSSSGEPIDFLQIINSPVAYSTDLSYVLALLPLIVMTYALAVSNFALKGKRGK